MLEKSLSFCCEYAAIIWQTANIQRSLFCQTNFVCWVFATRSEYIANDYCKQCSSQNIRSFFVRYSHKDSFSVRVVKSADFYDLKINWVTSHDLLSKWRIPHTLYILLTQSGRSVDYLTFVFTSTSTTSTTTTTATTTATTRHFSVSADLRICMV